MSAVARHTLCSAVAHHAVKSSRGMRHERKGQRELLEGLLPTTTWLAIVHRLRLQLLFRVTARNLSLATHVTSIRLKLLAGEEEQEGRGRAIRLPSKYSVCNGPKSEAEGQSPAPQPVPRWQWRARGSLAAMRAQIPR